MGFPKRLRRGVEPVDPGALLGNTLALIGKEGDVPDTETMAHDAGEDARPVVVGNMAGYARGGGADTGEEGTPVPLRAQALARNAARLVKLILLGRFIRNRRQVGDLVGLASYHGADGRKGTFHGLALQVEIHGKAAGALLHEEVITKNGIGHIPIPRPHTDRAINFAIPAQPGVEAIETVIQALRREGRNEAVVGADTRGVGGHVAPGGHVVEPALAVLLLPNLGRARQVKPHLLEVGGHSAKRQGVGSIRVGGRDEAVGRKAKGIVAHRGKLVHGGHEDTAHNRGGHRGMGGRGDARHAEVNHLLGLGVPGGLRNDVLGGLAVGRVDHGLLKLLEDGKLGLASLDCGLDGGTVLNELTHAAEEGARRNARAIDTEASLEAPLDMDPRPQFERKPNLDARHIHAVAIPQRPGERYAAVDVHGDAGVKHIGRKLELVNIGPHKVEGRAEVLKERVLAHPFAGDELFGLPIDVEHAGHGGGIRAAKVQVVRQPIDPANVGAAVSAALVRVAGEHLQKLRLGADGDIAFVGLLQHASRGVNALASRDAVETAPLRVELAIALKPPIGLDGLNDGGDGGRGGGHGHGGVEAEEGASKTNRYLGVARGIVQERDGLAGQVVLHSVLGVASLERELGEAHGATQLFEGLVSRRSEAHGIAHAYGEGKEAPIATIDHRGVHGEIAHGDKAALHLAKLAQHVLLAVTERERGEVGLASVAKHRDGDAQPVTVIRGKIVDVPSEAAALLVLCSAVGHGGAVAVQPDALRLPALLAKCAVGGEEVGVLAGLLGLAQGLEGAPIGAAKAVPVPMGALRVLQGNDPLAAILVPKARIGACGHAEAAQLADQAEAVQAIRKGAAEAEALARIGEEHQAVAQLGVPRLHEGELPRKNLALAGPLAEGVPELRIDGENETGIVAADAGESGKRRNVKPSGGQGRTRALGAIKGF